MSNIGGHGDILFNIKFTKYAPPFNRILIKYVKNDSNEHKFYNCISKTKYTDTEQNGAVIKLLEWIPKYAGDLTFENCKEYLTEDSFNKVLNRMAGETEDTKNEARFLVLEDINFDNGLFMDLKMGTRRFDSNAIKKHQKCKNHKKKNITKLQHQTNKRDKNTMIKKYGVNIVSGKTIDGFIGDKNIKQENTYDKVKDILVNKFLQGNDENKEKLLDSLQKIKEMFNSTAFTGIGLHFFSSSLFITLSEDMSQMNIKMIDFAHVESTTGILGYQFNGKPIEAVLNVFIPETKANNQCGNDTPNILENENKNVDNGYILGLKMLINMLNGNPDPLSQGVVPNTENGLTLNIKLKF